MYVYDFYRGQYPDLGILVEVFVLVPYGTEIYTRNPADTLEANLTKSDILWKSLAIKIFKSS